MATTHSLINNCLACGRIVCDKEGEGPCMFCANPVLKPENINEYEEQMKLLKDMEDDPEIMKSYIKAVENKNKLIGFDKSDIARKNMIDEDTDWYEIKNDVWQSDEIRSHALNKMIELEDEEQEAKDSFVTAFDMKAGTMVNSKQVVDYKKHRAEASKFLTDNDKGIKGRNDVEDVETDSRLKKKQTDVLKGINKQYQKQQSKLEGIKSDKKEKKDKQIKFLTKIEHEDCFEDYQKALKKMQRLKASAAKSNQISKEHFDIQIYPSPKFSTACLSMWQPWASLLVYGFKRYEGRQWSTEYRGPLWIHAGSRQPTEQEIQQVQAHYKMLYSQDPSIEMPDFPTDYPTGCLIGVIDLQDVITQDVYKKYVPQQYTKESTSENLFVARNPRRLKVSIRMPGKSGIFNLEEQVVQTACNTLVKVPSKWFPYYADKIPRKNNQNGQFEGTSGEIPSFSKRLKPVFSNVDVGPCKFLKMGKLESEMLNTHFYVWMTEFQKVFGKQISNGPGGCKELAFDKTVPKFDKVLKVVERLYTDLKDEEFDLENSNCKLDYFSQVFF